MPFNHVDIQDLQWPPLPAGPSGGYAVNIRPWLMAPDLAPYVVTPREPFLRWYDDPPAPAPTILIRGGPREGAIDIAATLRAQQLQGPRFATVFLKFPDEAAAAASSLGQYWNDPE